MLFRPPGIVLFCTSFCSYLVARIDSGMNNLISFQSATSKPNFYSWLKRIERTLRPLCLCRWIVACHDPRKGGIEIRSSFALGRNIAAVFDQTDQKWIVKLVYSLPTGPSTLPDHWLYMRSVSGWHSLVSPPSVQGLQRPRRAGHSSQNRIEDSSGSPESQVHLRLHPSYCKNRKRMLIYSCVA